MQDVERDGKKKQVKTDLEIILATEMGLLSTLKRIKFNPKPSNTTQNTIDPNQTRLIDFHMEISKKIDEVIQKHEQENTAEQKIAEPRTTWTKTPQTPIFKTEIQIDTETTSFDNESLEPEIPTNNNIKQSLQAEPFIQNQPVFVGPIQPKNTSIFAVGDHSEDKLLTTLGKIKINKERLKNTQKTKTSKKNGYSKAKNNYQEVKTELEKKKHELEEIERLAKQKEEELKKKEQEKKLKEKQKIIEQKRREKEEIIERKRREKEEKLKAKQELKLAKQQEQERKKEEKIKELEQIKLEKEKQRELKEQEKLKELKAKQKEKELKEQEKIKELKAKEKELKEQKRLKELKSKEIEKEKQRELKEQKRLKALKEKQIEEKKKKQQKAKKITKEKKPIKINFLKKKETKKEKKVIKPEIKTTKKQPETNLQPPEDDLIKAFEIIDDLLGKLPEDTIDEFARSDDFEIYEKVLSKYKKK